MDRYNINQLNSKKGGICFSVMITVFLFLSVIVSAVSLFISNEVLKTAVQLLVAPFSIIVVIIYCVKSCQINLCSAISIKSFNRLWCVASLLLSLGMFFGLGFINDLFATALQSIGLNVSGTNIRIDSVAQVVLYCVTLALLPAVLEETFFRGLILNSVKECKTLSVCLTCGLIFALYHSSAVQLVYQFIFGVLLTLLTVRAKSVFPAMISHFINNFAVIILTYLNVDINLYDLRLIAFGVLCLVGFIAVCFFYKSQEFIKGKNSVISFYIPWALWGMIICLALIIGGLLV